MPQRTKLVIFLYILVPCSHVGVYILAKNLIEIELVFVRTYPDIF